MILHQRERRMASLLIEDGLIVRPVRATILMPYDKPMTEFFVIMQKRSDGQVYADLHKSVDKIYLTELDARNGFQNEVKWDLRGSFHIVRLIAYTEDEHALTVEEDLQKYYEKRAVLPLKSEKVA